MKADIIPHYHLSPHQKYAYEIFQKSQKDETVQEISAHLWDNLTNYLKGAPNSADNREVKHYRGLTSQDLFSVIKPVDDSDLAYLNGLLRRKEDKESSIDYGKLNYILDSAGKHTLRYGLSINFFRDFLKDFCTVKFDEGWNIYFRISSPEEWQRLVQKLTNFEGYDDVEKFILNQRSGLFLKNLFSFSDLEKTPVYRRKRDLFEYLNDDVFEKIIGCKIIPTHEKTTISQPFSLPINGQIINGELRGNIKSQNSLVDKIRRDSTYSVAKAMNDIIRYTFVLENHEQVVRFLEYFIERYMSGIKNFFDADPDLTKLDIKDKGVFNSHYEEERERLELIQNPTIKSFVAKTFSQPQANTIKRTYKDVKLIVPVYIRGEKIKIEVKFVTKSWAFNNEYGFNRHEIMRLVNLIDGRSRDQKFITKQWLKEECRKLANSIPSLQDEISLGNTEQTANKIYDYMMQFVKTIKTLPDDDELMISRKIMKNYDAYGFYPKS